MNDDSFPENEPAPAPQESPQAAMPDPTVPPDDFLKGLDGPKPAAFPEEHLVNKGDNISMMQMIPSLHEIVIGAGWDHKMFEESPLDVDLSCFLLDKNDQTREDSDFVFYNNDKACDGAVRYMGDSRGGAGDGDDETLIIDLNGVPFDVVKIIVTLTIYNAREKEQAFGLVRNLYLRIMNAQDDNELFRFKLSEEEYAREIGIKVCELERAGPKWFFNALGEPIPEGLSQIATQYGLIIQL